MRVSLPLLWTRPNTSDIYKINESPYFSTATPKHSPNNIPGQHVDNDQVSTGIDLSLRHCDLPPAESRICAEFKEVSSGTISENRIFGMVIDSVKMGILLRQEKLVKLMSKWEQVSESKENTIMDLTKLIGKLGSTAQAILPAQLQVRYFQHLQIQALKLLKCCHAKVHLDKDAKDEPFWLIEN